MRKMVFCVIQIVRTVIKEFGPICWEKCPAEYKDLGAVCAKDSYGRGVGTPLSECPKGTEKKGVLCYESCPKDYHWLLLDCVKDCPSGFKDTGHHCLKPSYSRTGRIPDKKNCKDWDSSWRDDGISCWSDPHIYTKSFPSKCKQGYTNLGLSCAKKDIGMKKTVFQRQTCKDDEEMQVGLCYKKCKQGHKGVGPVCLGNCPSSMTDIGISCQKNNMINRSAHPKKMVCANNKEEDTLLCYDKCKETYKGVGPVCWKKCPSTMKDLAISCAKNSNGRGLGKPLECGGEFPDKIVALCYADCDKGYVADGVLCKQK